jgi:hypothetical protein
MAKSLRSSVKKSNRSKLRSRVFAPIEDARNERLSAKLLALASQPKPPKSEMEVDSQPSKASAAVPSVDDPSKSRSKEDTLTVGAEAQERAEGLSSSLSLQQVSCQAGLANQEKAGEEMLYMLLGLASEVVGFESDGRLLLQFHGIY